MFVDITPTFQFHPSNRNCAVALQIFYLRSNIRYVWGTTPGGALYPSVFDAGVSHFIGLYFCADVDRHISRARSAEHNTLSRRACALIVRELRAAVVPTSRPANVGSRVVSAVYTTTVISSTEDFGTEVPKKPQVADPWHNYNGTQQCTIVDNKRDDVLWFFLKKH
ncbi:hypothetical protein HPB48_020734 [Haemaphysalis longicornis]|uniref:Uncharacterized protein n=1 Tax=Haemaphysalis longicornis TaxID=44386 RepID=A0A9J6G997_HAELO|nr:hypothetical protein HPB48_020734 [Haemaphysalis longicornis]